MNNAVKGGDLAKPERCEICAAGDQVQAHHSGYKEHERLKVTWLCPSCHAEEDAKRREEERTMWSATVSLEYA